jgi:hypothetical protein
MSSSTDDFDFQPSLDKRLIMDLATLSFLERNESILFISRMNGVGKSHIARSLGYIACQKEYKTYYTTCSELINDQNAGVYEKTLGKRMRKYISCDLLIPATECTRANSCKRNTHPRIRNSSNLKKETLSRGVKSKMLTSVGILFFMQSKTFCLKTEQLHTFLKVTQTKASLFQLRI